jgi:glutaminase
MEDLDSCETDLVNSGAIVMNDSLNAENESAQVVVNVKDKSDFIHRFSQTESYELSSLCDE